MKSNSGWACMTYVINLSTPFTRDFRHPLGSFSLFVSDLKKKKDKRKHYCAVDKCSSEQ